MKKIAAHSLFEIRPPFGDEDPLETEGEALEPSGRLGTHPVHFRPQEQLALAPSSQPLT
jgi:hypothetical protein